MDLAQPGHHDGLTAPMCNTESIRPLAPLGGVRGAQSGVLYKGLQSLCPVLVGTPSSLHSAWLSKDLHSQAKDFSRVAPALSAVSLRGPPQTQREAGIALSVP